MPCPRGLGSSRQYSQYSQLEEAGSFGQLQKAGVLKMCQLPLAFLFVRCTLEIDVGLIGSFGIQYLLPHFNLVFSHITVFQNQKVKNIAVIQIQQ